MRPLIYYVACTVDGYIARTDGSFDFALASGEHLADLMRAFPETVPTHLRAPSRVTAPNQVFDTVLMGRATYEVGVALGVTSPYTHLRQYLFSQTLGRSPDPHVELVHDDVLATVQALKRESGKAIWLCGGARLAGAIAGEIDEFILKINPVVIGSGIPLVAGTAHDLALALVEDRNYANGFALRRYRVTR